MIRSGNGGPVACAGLRVVAKISGDWCIAKIYIYIYVNIYSASSLKSNFLKDYDNDQFYLTKL